MLAQVSFESAVSRRVLDPNQPLVDVQVYTASRVPAIPSFKTGAEWEQYATTLRKRVLDEVIFRGEAAKWRDAKTKVEILEPFASGAGYRVRHIRYEAIPGLWIPGLIYEPQPLSGKVPVVLNVNGHEGNGTATPYIQARCINLAKKGVIAVNPEWVGMGQLRTDGFNHTRMPQIDLAGTSGIAIHYLAQKRALDLIEKLPNADTSRIAVTGLSGGGWQTILISSLDTRVKAAMPLAGYSSFLTRAQWPDLDLGDAEQTPSDLGAVADYSHLTALVAPRALQIANNAKDNCCFRADYALAPLVQAATPVYRLLNALDKLSYHVNHGAGHNYDADNREAFYRLVKEQFQLSFDPVEIDVDSEIRPQEALRPPLPADNLDFHKIALSLAPQGDDSLAKTVRYKAMKVEAFGAGEGYWKLKLDRAWHVPAFEIKAANAVSTDLVIADEGRASVAKEIAALGKQGRRVIAIDPFYLGESRIAKRDWLFAILIASLGERPIGIQVSQVAAIARWAGGGVRLHAFGPRTSLVAQIAAKLDPKAVSQALTHGAFGSLKEVLEKDLTVDKYPELFSFGLLAHFR